MRLTLLALLPLAAWAADSTAPTTAPAAAPTAPVGWAVNLKQWVASPPLLMGQKLFVPLSDRVVELDAATGAERASAVDRSPSDLVAMAEAGLIAVRRSDGSIHALRVDTLAEVWTASGPFDGMSAVGNLLVEWKGATLHALDAATGAERWTTTNPGGSCGGAHGFNGHIFTETPLTASTPSISAFDPATGQLQWTKPWHTLAIQTPGLLLLTSVPVTTPVPASAWANGGPAMQVAYLSPATGDLARKFPLPVGCSVIMTEASLLVESCFADPNWDPEAGPPDINILAVDSTTGGKRWSSGPFRGDVRGNVDIQFDNSRIVLTEPYGTIAVLDSTSGRVVWKSVKPDSQAFPPALSEATTYRAMRSGLVGAGPMPWRTK